MPKTEKNLPLRSPDTLSSQRRAMELADAYNLRKAGRLFTRRPRGKKNIVLVRNGFAIYVIPRNPVRKKKKNLSLRPRSKCKGFLPLFYLLNL